MKGPSSKVLTELAEKHVSVIQMLYENFSQGKIKVPKYKELQSQYLQTLQQRLR